MLRPVTVARPDANPARLTQFRKYVLELVVTRKGRPSEIRVIRSFGSERLDDDAIRAVRQWRFTPGRLSGKPVDVLVTIVLDFTIH